MAKGLGLALRDMGTCRNYATGSRMCTRVAIQVRDSVQNPNPQISRERLHALDIGVQGPANTCTTNCNAHDNKAVTMKARGYRLCFQTCSNDHSSATQSC